MRRLRRPIACVLLLWSFPACAPSTTWTAQPVVPQPAKRTMFAGEVLVETSGGATYLFRGVWVSADSIGGWLTEPTGTELSFPLNEVAAVHVREGGARAARTRRSSAWATGALIGVLLGGALGGGGTYVVCQSMDLGFGSPSAASRDAACGQDAVRGLALGALAGGVLGLVIGVGVSNSGR